MQINASHNISEIEKHINNYFNPRNDPDSPERNHPPEFLELCERIRLFREENPPSNIVAEQVVGLYSFTTATLKATGGVPAGWQSIFAQELSIYKRAKFI